MITIQGKGVSTGVALGPLYFYQRAKSTVTRYEITDTEAEWARFKAAQEKAIAELGAVLPMLCYGFENALRWHLLLCRWANE